MPQCHGTTVPAASGKRHLGDPDTRTAFGSRGATPGQQRLREAGLQRDPRDLRYQSRVLAPMISGLSGTRAPNTTAFSGMQVNAALTVRRRRLERCRRPEGPLPTVMGPRFLNLIRERPWGVL